jgi:hypothetical protein
MDQVDLSSGETDRVATALVRVTLREPDRAVVESLLATHLCSRDPWVRGVAATCVGHVARIHGALDTARLLPLLRSLAADPQTAGRVSDALGDIEVFIGRDVLDAHERSAVSRDRALWLPLCAPWERRILSAEEARAARAREGVRELCPELDGETAWLDVLRASDGAIVGVRFLVEWAAIAILEQLEPCASARAHSERELDVCWREGAMDDGLSRDWQSAAVWFVRDPQVGTVAIVDERAFLSLPFERIVE